MLRTEKVIGTYDVIPPPHHHFSRSSQRLPSHILAASDGSGTPGVLPKTSPLLSVKYGQLPPISDSPPLHRQSHDPVQMFGQRSLSMGFTVLSDDSDSGTSSSEEIDVIDV